MLHATSRSELKPRMLCAIARRLSRLTPEQVALLVHPISEWLRDRDFIQSRLKQEIVNLKFGVERGDRIEMQRDPIVRRAVQSLSAPPR